MSRRVLTFSIPIHKLTVEEAAALLLALLEARLLGAWTVTRRPMRTTVHSLGGGRG
jgi:hypothetical protein